MRGLPNSDVRSRTAYQGGVMKAGKHDDSGRRQGPTGLTRRSLARVLLGLAAVWVAWLGFATRADAQNDGRLAVELRNVVSGQQLPAVLIRPAQDLRKLTISLERADGEKQTLRSGPVAAGQQQALAVRQPVGSFRYRADFEADWGGGDVSTFAMTFDMTRAGKLELLIEPKDVDLDARTMTFRISNPATRATLTLVGAGGKVMAEVDKSFHRPRPNTPLTLTWQPPNGELLYMDLKVYDLAGFWKGVRLTPFSVHIPHDDVVFDTDRWDIKAREEPKLEATLAKIEKALEEHGQLLQLKLFVAGYTDTVGSKQHNQRLSTNRARSIATWFRRKGLRIPIYYQGFGEEVLKVDTPDETDEARNRRALYLLASQRPPQGRELPRDAWTAL